MTDFERLYNDNCDFIFKYLVKLTSNASLAEELTQETFFRAYMNFAGLRDRKKAGVWLCRIAKNTFFAWYNENKKLQPLEDTTCFERSEDIEENYVNKEFSQKAMACLQSLDEPYKEVFMLSVFGGLTLKEISASFDKSESWARVTFYRAKQKLSERMKKEDEL